MKHIWQVNFTLESEMSKMCDLQLQDAVKCIWSQTFWQLDLRKCIGYLTKNLHKTLPLPPSPLCPCSNPAELRFCINLKRSWKSIISLKEMLKDLVCALKRSEGASINDAYHSLLLISFPLPLPHPISLFFQLPPLLFSLHCQPWLHFQDQTMASKCNFK